MSAPHKNTAAVALGRLGGAAGTGKAKARTSPDARAKINAGFRAWLEKRKKLAEKAAP